MKWPHDELSPGVPHEELTAAQREENWEHPPRVRLAEGEASRPDQVDAAGRGPLARVGLHEALAGQPPEEPHRDQHIRDQVLSHLEERGEAVREVQPNVRDGMVHLEGRVPSEEARRAAESAAATVAEARGVASRLRVHR